MSSPKLPALYDVAIYAKGRCDRAHHDLLPLSDNFEIWAGEEAKARRYESMVVGNEKGNEKGVSRVRAGVGTRCSTALRAWRAAVRVVTWSELCGCETEGEQGR